MVNEAILSCDGRYTKLYYNGKNITFRHGKDLIKYLSVKKWDKGNLTVDCLGKVKGQYENYIDLPYILENLYMNPALFLKDLKGVTIQNGEN